MADMGLKVEKHHHEVAPAQAELGVESRHAGQDRRRHADLQIRRAQRRPPVRQDRDLHAQADQGRQRLGHAHPPVDLEGRASRCSPATSMPTCRETALYYIGGIIKHAKAINAFTNPTTNSYKRLIPGFEAPVLLAYSARNRSASCRIPIVSSPKAKRVEVRFPDPAANPYLGFAAMLMAGLDGIQNKIHPGDPMDKNLYDLPPEELKDVPTVCGSLREALGRTRRRPRLPAQGRRLHQGPDRSLHRAEMGGGLQLRAHPAPDRVPDVLLGLTGPRIAPAKTRPLGARLFLAQPRPPRGREPKNRLHQTLLARSSAGWSKPPVSRQRAGTDPQGLLLSLGLGRCRFLRMKG